MSAGAIIEAAKKEKEAEEKKNALTPPISKEDTEKAVKAADEAAKEAEKATEEAIKLKESGADDGEGDADVKLDPKDGLHS